MRVIECRVRVTGTLRRMWEAPGSYCSRDIEVFLRGHRLSFCVCDV